MRVCRKCAESKDESVFNKNRNECKICQAAIKKAWYNKNKQHVLSYKRNYELENSEKIKESKAAYNAKNSDAIRVYNADRYYKNRKKEINRVSEYTKNRLKTDPAYRLKFNLRRRISAAISRKGKSKIYSIIEGIGCTCQQLKEYLERKFTNGMSWENYGSFWHVDHIKPLAIFDLSNKEEYQAACHYTNLQPLEAIENLRKHCKIR